jgi:hypothetical protein
MLIPFSTVAAASRPFNFKREDLAFPIDTIPAVCDEPCKIYKDVFTTCPDNGGAEVCTSVCNVSFKAGTLPLKHPGVSMNGLAKPPFTPIPPSAQCILPHSWPRRSFKHL